MFEIMVHEGLGRVRECSQKINVAGYVGDPSTFLEYGESQGAFYSSFDTCYEPHMAYARTNGSPMRCEQHAEGVEMFSGMQHYREIRETCVVDKCLHFAGHEDEGLVCSPIRRRRCCKD